MWRTAPWPQRSKVTVGRVVFLLFKTDLYWSSCVWICFSWPPLLLETRTSGCNIVAEQLHYLMEKNHITDIFNILLFLVVDSSRLQSPVSVDHSIMINRLHDLFVIKTINLSRRSFTAEMNQVSSGFRGTSRICFCFTNSLKTKLLDVILISHADDIQLYFSVRLYIYFIHCLL